MAQVKVRHDTVLENFPLFCLKCKGNMEVFMRDGMLAADARCESCGFSMEAGTKAEELELEE